MRDYSVNVVSVIGLGYAGLPVALAFAERGVKVVGVDIDPNKVNMLKEGNSYVEDISDDTVGKNLRYFHPTTEYSLVSQADAVIICVPTPLNKTLDPDLSHIVSASQNIAEHIRPGMLVVLESTTYPGTTEEVLKPILEEKGLRAGKDFFLAFSPERVDPGNKRFNVKNTPKVVGGITKACTDLAIRLYSIICDEVIPASSARAAEAVKLLENTFRVVNIGLINEVAQLCHRMSLDVWEIVDIASTKPYGFMPFYPGPGIGGHCIGVDPIYLSWKAKLFNFRTRFIELADEVNGKMPDYVVYRLFEVLNEHGRSINGSKVLILGVAYKKDVGDIRESPALRVIKLLQDLGTNISYNDPHVSEFFHLGKLWRSEELSERLLMDSDCVLITTDHSSYNWQWVVENAPLILDTRNATRGFPAGRVRRL